MNRFPKALTIISFLAATATAQPASQPAKSTKPIGSLAWLVGGAWVADASAFGNGMQRIETRYQWSDNDSYVRFNTHFITDKATIRTYDGHFFWNPGKSTLAMWYMDAANQITEGPVQVDGDTMEMFFSGHDFQGALSDLRVVVTRKNENLYHWALSKKRDNGWQELAALDYARKP